MKKLFILIIALLYTLSASANLINAKDHRAKQHQERMLKLFQAGKLDAPMHSPRASFTDSNGNTHNLKEYRGKTIIFYVWGGWCQTCIQELISLDNMQKELIYNDIEDVAIIPVALSFKGLSNVVQIFNKHNIEKLDIFLDSDKEVSSAFQVNFAPHTFIIDKKGNIIARFRQNMDWGDGRSFLQVFTQ
jgi:thiol-disulfide isomerase/thioredoxin